MHRLAPLCLFAVSACGTGTSDQPALPAPSDVVVTPRGSGLHVTWKDNSSDEDEFQVERKSAGGFAMIGSVVFDTIQYHDEPLTPGTAYTYRVRALKGTAPSAYSNSVTATAPGGGDAGTGGPDAGAGNQAPSCTITSPDAGSVFPYDQVITLGASATDPEDGPLTGGSVVWSSNRAPAALGTGTTLTRALPVPGVHTITCTATDSQGLTGSSTLTVTAASPVAVINHPGTGETRAASMAIPFVGDGRDFEDGPLPDAALVWTSTLDGRIGTGRTFSRTLSAGTNVVTLTVTDADGGTGARTISLTITP